MERGTVFALELADVDPAVLCAVVALVLAGLIVGGFVLFWRGERAAIRSRGGAHHGPHGLGLLSLWQMERTLRGTGERLPTVGRARPDPRGGYPGGG
jgi:hypothetical protein